MEKNEDFVRIMTVEEAKKRYCKTEEERQRMDEMAKLVSEANGNMKVVVKGVVKDGQ